MQANAVELVIFKTNAGFSDTDLVAAVNESNKFLKRCPGFIHRQLSKTAEGQWADVVQWQDMDSAKKAAEGFMGAPECSGFMQMLDPQSIQMFHLSPATLEL
jgi:hypothetical protein